MGHQRGIHCRARSVNRGSRPLLIPGYGLVSADGRLADGRAFLDLTSWLPGNRLTTNQSTLPREIQFLHRGQERFLYAVRFYALTNGAPSSFATNSVTEIGVGSLYQYGAKAIDPEGDELRYTLIAAPSTATIDAATGAILWNPTESDIGSTRWIIRATDPKVFLLSRVLM